MFRTTSLFLLLGCLAVSGCGSSNDSIAQDMLNALNNFSDALESGDKAKIQAASTKLTNLVKEHKDKKISESERKRMDEKYKPQLEAAMKRMQAAVAKAVSSGKMTQQEMLGFMQSMLNMK